MAVKRGFAFVLKEDIVLIRDINDPSAFIVERAFVGETEEQALERVRNGLGIRVPVSQTKNVQALPRLLQISGFQATVNSATVIKLDWDPFPLTGSYELQRSTDNLTWTSLPNQTGTTYTNTGLTAGTPYYYRIRPKSVLGIVLSGWVTINAETLAATTGGAGNTPSQYRPPELDAITVRGDGDDNRIGVRFNTAVTNVKIRFTNRSGTAVSNSGLTDPLAYNPLTDAVPIGPGDIGSLRIFANGATPKPVITGQEYLIGVRYDVGGITKTFLIPLTGNTNNQNASLNLPGLEGDGTNASGSLRVFAKISYDVEIEDNTPTFNPAQHRLAGLNIYFPESAPDGSMTQRDKNAITLSAQKGYNFVRLSIVWEQIEKSTPGVYDTRKIDEAATLAQSLGLWIFWSFDMARSNNNNPVRPDGTTYVPLEHQVYDISGRRHMDSDNNMPSYSSMFMQERMFGFVADMATHIKSKPYHAKSILWSFTTTGGKEVGFPFTNLINNNQTSVLTSYDYGSAAQAGFRSWVQAQSRFSTISKVNAAWNTNYGSYNDVSLAAGSDYGEGYYGFSNQHQLDSYVYSEQSVADQSLAFKAKLQTIIPGAKVVCEVGSMFDNRAVSNRHTGTLTGRLAGIEGIKQNGAADYTKQRIRLSTCISKQDWGPNRVACDELGIQDQDVPISSQRTYMENFFDCGGNLITVANFWHPFLTDQQALDRISALAGNNLAALLAGTPRTTSDGTYTANMRRLVTQGGWYDTSPQMFTELEAVPGDFTHITWDSSTLTGLT